MSTMDAKLRSESSDTRTQKEAVRDVLRRATLVAVCLGCSRRLLSSSMELVALFLFLLEAMWPAVRYRYCTAAVSAACGTTAPTTDHCRMPTPTGMILFCWLDNAVTGGASYCLWGGRGRGLLWSDEGTGLSKHVHCYARISSKGDL